MRAPTQAIRPKPVSAQVELVLAAGVGVLSILLTLVLPVVPRLAHHFLDWEWRALAALGGYALGRSRRRRAPLSCTR